MTDPFNYEALAQELWEVFEDNSDAELFQALRSNLALPQPDQRELLPGPSKMREPIPDEKRLVEQIGLLIKENPSVFEPLAVAESPGPYPFNPTELTARFVSYFIQDIRDLLCGDQPLLGVPGQALAVKLATAIGVGVLFTTQAATTAIAALMLVTVLKMTHGSICKMTDTQLIDALIDPHAVFEKSPAVPGRLKKGRRRAEGQCSSLFLWRS